MSNRMMEAIAELAKYNPYHDAKGRFTSGDGAHVVSVRGKDGKGGGEGSHTTALGMQHKSGGKLGVENKTPEYKEGGFKTREEAMGYIGTHFQSTKGLDDAPLEALNSIAGGLHDAKLSEFGVKIGTLHVSDLGGAFANYGRGNVFLDRSSSKSSANAFGVADTMGIDPKYLIGHKETAEKIQARYASRNPNTDNNRRWAISADDKDPLRATIAHEAGHAIQRQGQGVVEYFDAKYKRIPKAMRSQVSDYAASSSTEMFAEVHSAVSRGRRADVPDRILKAYDEALANYQRTTHRTN